MNWISLLGLETLVLRWRAAALEGAMALEDRAELARLEWQDQKRRLQQLRKVHMLPLGPVVQPFWNRQRFLHRFFEMCFRIFGDIHRHHIHEGFLVIIIFVIWNNRTHQRRNRNVLPLAVGLKKISRQTIHRHGECLVQRFPASRQMIEIRKYNGIPAFLLFIKTGWIS